MVLVEIRAIFWVHYLKPKLNFFCIVGGVVRAHLLELEELWPLDGAHLEFHSTGSENSFLRVEMVRLEHFVLLDAGNGDQFFRHTLERLVLAVRRVDLSNSHVVSLGEILHFLVV